MIDLVGKKYGDYCPLNCRWLTINENTARANKNHTPRKVIRGEVR